ncbi:MAG TPA: carboxypeptidase-like regulatory domain-containing protein [Blastocatellia bacterium]|nr:carboxypeptidase-like regulatory domain-containing protein [Blastocatellia bacterium]
MKLFPSLLFAFVSLCWAGVGYAQESRAVVLGRVTDASGAGVPGAKVMAQSLDTGITTSSVANEAGGYQINYLQPGPYKITVEATGFKKIARDSIDVRVGDRLALDFTLEVGSLSDTVSITSEAPLLDTSSATSGMVIDGKRAAELPMVGGNAFYLSRLAPGVMTSGGRSGANPFDYGSGTNLIGNGARSGTSEVTLDGSPNMFERNTSFSPPQDLVAEFKIQTISYDASIGHASGALTNVSIKSGTKDLHGTAYMNDSRLRAIPWHTNRFLGIQTAQPGANVEQIRERNVPTWLHQRWGATATGPIVIPKLYNGRAKTFWSFGYEGLKIKRNLSFTGTVPTAKQRNGDFSELLPLGATYQIYDPFTIRPAANGRFSRTALAGNIIPANRIDPVAKKILAFFPLPNQPGSADGRQNYFTTQKIDRSNRNFLGRVDHNFNEKHRLFVRYTENYQYDTTIPFEGGATGTVAEQPGRGVAVDDVYTFGPTLIMNLRYSLSHQTPIAGRITNGFDLLSLGFPPSLVNEIKAKNNIAGVSFPSINITNYTSIGQDGGNQRSIYYHVFGSTFTKIVNSHSVKFGGEYRLQRENGFNYGNVAPTFTFAEAYTRGPLDNSPVAPIGHGLASFLLGVPTGGSVSLNASRAQQSDYLSAFVHNDWRVSNRLTINAGIRYEIEGPPTERFNRSIRGFDPFVESPIAAQALANYRANPIPELPVANFKTLGGLNFAGVGGNPRGLWKSDTNNFMPRLGLAWSLNQKTVVRAGIGVYFDTIGVDREDVNQGGFNQATNFIPTLNNGQTYIASLSNPFPNGFQTPPGASQGVRTFLGRGISFFQERPLNPYNTRWSLAVQRELPGRMVAEVTYVGSRANKLGLTRNLNALPARYLSTKTERDQATIDFLGAQVRNPFFGIADFAGTGLAGQNVARSQLLRPFPHFGDILVGESSGYSWYHSMQVSVEKRLTKGLTFQASWTYSKFMQATEFLNDQDLRPSEVISDQDYPHRFVLNGIYELPFGKGKKFLSDANWFAEAVLGGWQLQGWYEGQSGEALGFGNVIVRGNLRDLVLPVSQRTTDAWFNLTAANTVFERDPAKQLASNLRTLPLRFSFIRADGTNNFDLSLFKNYQLTEKFKIQFRAESFNALNHVQFANPATGVTNTAFGTITNEKGHGQRQWTFGLKLMF